MARNNISRFLQACLLVAGLSSANAEVVLDYGSRQGKSSLVKALLGDAAADTCVRQQLTKLRFRVSATSDMENVRVLATADDRGKAFYFANDGTTDVCFAPVLRGDYGSAFHLYDCSTGVPQPSANQAWRAGDLLKVPSGSGLLGTTQILDIGGERRTGSHLHVNKGRFRGAPEDLIRHVNPFIGTAWNGHCYPGASWPFGLVSASPDTGRGDWQHSSGYVYLDPYVYGFSQTHLNGTGAVDLGDILLQPFVGDKPLARDDFRGLKDFASECAWPGYYDVTLTNFSVRAEISATPHVGWHRYTFPEGCRPRVLVDLQYGCVKERINDHVTRATCTVSEETGRICGENETSSWLKGRHVGFDIAFSRPFRVVRKMAKKPGERADRLVLEFDLVATRELVAKVAISTVDAEGAHRNMEAEAPGWDFDATVAACGDAWRELLSRVTVSGVSGDSLSVFYTALYHSFVQPVDTADADGRARDEATKVFRPRRGHHYSDFSFWDTFRAAFPLYTVVVPERVDDFCESAIASFRAAGYLPVQAWFGRDAFTMIGNHSVPVIVDAYLKGFRGFDAMEAFVAVTNSLTVCHRLPNGGMKKKEDWPILDRYGYYPWDIVRNESVSRTLECSYDDWCAAEFARALGQAEAERFFRKRSQNWRNVFDARIGFMRGRDAAGAWREPFDPMRLGHSSEPDNDFTQGNSWQYTWHVLQDAEGLMEAMGGAKAFVGRLDRLFREKPNMESGTFMQGVTGLIGQYCHGNEPSHHVPYLFALAERPERTAEIVRRICSELYLPTAGGLCGNDDCGQMSAWYVFACLGFYPVNPCGGEFVLGAPQVPRTVIRLAGGRKLAIEARGLSASNRYVRAVRLNGRPLAKTVAYSEIVAGGELVFEMSAVPSP